MGTASQTSNRRADLAFLHGGWGKVAAAGSTQYAIDRWAPARLINLGTCGGFKGVLNGDR
jgi:nucleoside phosphorylase